MYLSTALSHAILSCISFPCAIPCPCFLHMSSLHYPIFLFSAHTRILTALPRAPAFCTRLFIALCYTSVICTRICIAFPVDDVISRWFLRYTDGSNITAVSCKKECASLRHGHVPFTSNRSSCGAGGSWDIPLSLRGKACLKEAVYALKLCEPEDLPIDNYIT